MTDDTDGVQLRVEAAAKDDAGRGVARVAEPARRALGVLSGDAVVIEGDTQTVVKVWPAEGAIDNDVIRIDADTRANAGTSIGETVTVVPQTIAVADTVVIRPPEALADANPDVVERVLTKRLQGRPVDADEQFTLETVTDEAFRIVRTDPAGPVRIDTSTTLTVTSAAESASGSADASRVSYEDIGGLDEELEQVREMIEIPLRRPALFRELGVDPPKGVLLYGPPGTGKTLIARAVANEVDAAFYSIDGPEIISKYKGESEKRLREVFEDARDSAPAIIFFDEIDSVAGERDEDADMETRIVGQLLSLMDGLDAREDVIVIGATNRVDALDPALRRGGRFDREIEIGVPDLEGRREILAVHTRPVPLGPEVDLEAIASRTHGFVGADIDALVTEAAMTALDRITTDEDIAVQVTMADFDAALARVDPSAMREFMAEAPETTFADVGGLDAAKQRLREAVEWPLTYNRLFSETATDPPSGVLLYGPPGTGKTLLARALAGETDVNFVHVDGPELVDKYVGESERAIRDVFDRARQAAPSIIFFDEIDAIVGRRGVGQTETTDRIVSQLLTELDGLRENPNLVVVAATNRKDDIDPALLRPGRIDTHVEVGLPDRPERRAILDVHCRGKPLANTVDLDVLASELAGYTGADIEAIVRDASLRAIREAAETHGVATANERAEEIEIRRDHFETAIEAVERTVAVADAD